MLDIPVDVMKEVEAWKLRVAQEGMPSNLSFCKIHRNPEHLRNSVYYALVECHATEDDKSALLRKARHRAQLTRARAAAYALVSESTYRRAENGRCSTERFIFLMTILSRSVDLVFYAVAEYLSNKHFRPKYEKLYERKMKELTDGWR